jgi:glycosyltransferase involved in cell wall biosynthesis
VTCIAEGIARELVEKYRIPSRLVEVVPNPVDLTRVRSLGQTAPDHPWFQLDQPVLVAVGRLHHQKGFDVLIRAFAQVRRRIPCKLLILGEGILEQELQRLIESLGLTEDAQLAGFQENPYNYMAHAAAFVLSSRYEGFGNVLVEALALGTPVVSTRCPVGPEEILEEGKTGILVPPEDELALAEAILRVLQDRELSATLSSNGPARAEAYSLTRITARYETLFSGLAGETVCAS